MPPVSKRGSIARPRVFIDADVLLAGAASPNENSASLVLLRMAEITLIDAITSSQVITEVERNLAEKIPKAMPAFQLLVSKSLRIVPDPESSVLEPYQGTADPKDLPILVAALHEDCIYLASFNVRHYQPGIPSIIVLKPGDLIQRIRSLLSNLG